MGLLQSQDTSDVFFSLFLLLDNSTTLYMLIWRLPDLSGSLCGFWSLQNSLSRLSVRNSSTASSCLSGSYRKDTGRSLCWAQLDHQEVWGLVLVPGISGIDQGWWDRPSRQFQRQKQADQDALKQQYYLLNCSPVQLLSSVVQNPFIFQPNSSKAPDKQSKNKGFHWPNSFFEHPLIIPEEPW